MKSFDFFFSLIQPSIRLKYEYTFSKLFILGRVPYAKKKFDESVNNARLFEEAV